MRAGRLVSVMLALQRRGRVTAGQLASELEVSERTILRDLDELSGAGVPIYATRGRGGGFQLLEPTSTLPDPEHWQPDRRSRGRAERALIRISPEGRRLAAVLGALQPIRMSRTVPPDSAGWRHATFRVRSYDAATIEILSLASHIEVMEPARLRSMVADRTASSAALYNPPADDSPADDASHEHDPKGHR
ncbi:MAG: HTH domain-containing protein [Ornithinimicrobium sp.]